MKEVEKVIPEDLEETDLEKQWKFSEQRIWEFYKRRYDSIYDTLLSSKDTNNNANNVADHESILYNKSVYDWKKTNWRDWNTCTSRTRLDWMSGSWMGSWKPDLITSVEKTVWSVQLIPFDEAIGCSPGITETDWMKPIAWNQPDCD